MLDRLTSADFAPYLNQLFTVPLEGGEPIALELVDVTEARAHGADMRPPFSLTFLGPVSRLYLQQHTYRIEHPRLGPLDLFIVPLGPQQGRMRYEVIFN